MVNKIFPLAWLYSGCATSRVIYDYRAKIQVMQ